MSINGSGEIAVSWGSADVRRGGDDGCEFGATRRHVADQAGEIARERVEVLRAHRGVHAIDVGMSDQQARHARPLLMRGKQFAIVMNGRARPEATDQAEASTFLARRGHDSGMLPT